MRSGSSATQGTREVEADRTTDDDGLDPAIFNAEWWARVNAIVAGMHAPDAGDPAAAEAARESADRMEEDDEGARAETGATGAAANTESVMFALFGEEEDTTADEDAAGAVAEGGTRGEVCGGTKKRKRHKHIRVGAGRQARWTAEEEYSIEEIGVATAGRPMPEVEPLNGSF